jgi:RHS repeat-associated protein
MENQFISQNPEKQPYKFGGKELDEMHGLNWYDFEARQLDAAIPRFTTMDPLAEKYYSVSPYAYCANNPVNNIDPDGKDYIMTIDLETMTITISGTYYASTQDLGSAQQAANAWNDQSGSFSYQTSNGNAFNVNFDITVSEVQTDASMKFGQKETAVRSATDGDTSGAANAYIVAPDINVPKNLNGTTQDGKYVYVRDSRSSTETGAHEMGHSLGLVHGGSGLMNPSSSDRSNNDVKANDITDMVNYPARYNTNKEGNAYAGKGTLFYTPNSAELPSYFYYHKKNKVNKR